MQILIFFVYNDFQQFTSNFHLCMRYAWLFGPFDLLSMHIHVSWSIYRLDFLWRGWGAEATVHHRQGVMGEDVAVQVLEVAIAAAVEISQPAF